MVEYMVPVGAASSGATSYNVKRATVSGGPYTTIATGVTATTYNNSGLTGGTTYYYVVSAVSSLGESTNSAEVVATPCFVPAAPTNVSRSASAIAYGELWAEARKRLEMTGLGPT